MSKTKTRRKGRLMWGLIYVGAFLVTFIASAAFKLTWNPLGEKYSVQWDDSVGTMYTDLSYGEGEANKFALFSHLDAHRDFYALLSRRGLVPLLKDVILSVCGFHPELEAKAAHASAFAAYSLYGWVEVWFLRGMEESPAEMAALFQTQGA